MSLTVKNKLSESLCLLNFATITPTELKKLEGLLSEIQENETWTAWLELVNLNSCESLIYINIKKYELTVPDSVLTILSDCFDRISIENDLRLKEAKIIFTKLNDAGIPFIILKGQALADTFYGSTSYKKMNDVDFLVQKSSLGSLESIYRDLNLQCAASLGGVQFRKQENYSHHWPPFFTPTLNCVLGTHWNIVTPLSPIQIEEMDLWTHSEVHSFVEIPCLRLNDLYFFFHLVVHLAYYKTGLKELCDPLNWFRSKKAFIDEFEFLELVKKANAYDPAYRNLCFLNLIHPDALLNRWIQALKPYTASFVVQDTALRTRELYYLIRSRSIQTSKIEKMYALFSLSDMFYEKFYFLAKMWKHFLVPKKADVLRMQNLADDSNFIKVLVGYLKTPYLLSRVFAFDLGWSLHILLIFRHHLDLVKSVLWFLVSVVSFGLIVPIPSTLAKKIKSLNLPIDSIEQIKNKLE